jgi:hypothetical protein
MRTIRAPYSGRCLCEAVHFRVTQEPLTVYACHCTDCQKRSGSAFGLSMWVKRPAIEVTKGEVTVHKSTGADGKMRFGMICGQCGTRMWSEPPKWPDYAVMRPGTLDDTSWLKPVAHIWTQSAQPWVVFPEGVPKYAKQAGDLQILIDLWRNRPR